MDDSSAAGCKCLQADGDCDEMSELKICLPCSAVHRNCCGFDTSPNMKLYAVFYFWFRPGDKINRQSACLKASVALRPFTLCLSDWHQADISTPVQESVWPPGSENVTFDPDKLRHQWANNCISFYSAAEWEKHFLGDFWVTEADDCPNPHNPGENIMFMGTTEKHETQTRDVTEWFHCVPYAGHHSDVFNSAEGNIAFINLMCSNFNKSLMVSSVPKCYVGNRRISLQDRILQWGRLREEKNVQLIDPFERTLCGEGCTNWEMRTRDGSLFLLRWPYGQERFVK